MTCKRKAAAAVSKNKNTLKFLSHRLVDEWSETQSNVKLDGFRSRFRASCVSSHTEEF